MWHSVWDVMFCVLQKGVKLNLMLVNCSEVYENNSISSLVDLCILFVFTGKTSKKPRRIGKKEQRHCKWNTQNYF